MDTTSLGFQKPKEEEYYDINIFNKNTQLANDLIEKNSSAIGQITNTRGYSKIPIISTDILLKNTNGWCRGYNIPNAPIPNTWLFYRTVIMDDSFPWGYGFVRAYDYENKKEFVNFRSTSGWEGWREIPTVNNISNPNLIINEIFQVWQRGTSFERISGKYTADRWLYDTHGKASGFNGKIEKIANGLKLTQLDGLSMNHRFRYLMEVLESLKGQKLTLTLKYKTNKVFGVSFLGNSLTTVADSNVNTLKATGTYNGDLELFSMATYNNTDTSMFLELYSVKLELGEIATPLSPRPYGEELALCQRYYEFISFSTRVPVNIYTGTTIGYEFSYPFKTKKRIQPTQVISKLEIESVSKTPEQYLNVFNAGVGNFGAFTNQNNVNWNLPAGTRVHYEGYADSEIY